MVSESEAQHAAKLKCARTEYYGSLWSGLAAYFIADDLVRFYSVTIGAYFASIGTVLLGFAIYRYVQLCKLDPKRSDRWITVFGVAVVIAVYAAKVILGVLRWRV